MFYKLSKATRKRMSESAKKRAKREGLSKVRLMWKVNRGKSLSEETKKKLSLNHKKRYQKKLSNLSHKELDKLLKCKFCGKKVHCKNLCRSCYDKQRLKNPVMYAKRQKQRKEWRNKNPLWQKEWKKQNPEKVKAGNKRWYKKHGKEYYYKNYEKISKLHKKSRLKYPERIKARMKIRTLVKRGNLPHPTECICNHCSSPAQEYHHYKGYENRNLLKVIPLCISCHRFADKKPKII